LTAGLDRVSPFGGFLPEGVLYTGDGMKPETLNILGIPYKIRYVDKLTDVTKNNRTTSVIGEIDYVDKIISIYDNGRSTNDIWETIMHEVIHGIAESLHIKPLTGEESEDYVDLLGLALNDFLFRNNLFNIGETN
jgi:hypothetical protein